MKYGEAPYALHLYQVVQVAQSVDLTEAQIAAAWLHDTVEDTDVAMWEIELEFEGEVAVLVAAVTDEPNRTRRERLSDLILRIGSIADLFMRVHAVELKLCDRIANVVESRARRPDLLRMYRREWKRFQELRQFGGETGLWHFLENMMPRD